MAALCPNVYSTYFRKWPCKNKGLNGFVLDKIQYMILSVLH